MAIGKLLPLARFEERAGCLLAALHRIGLYYASLAGMALETLVCQLGGECASSYARRGLTFLEALLGNLVTFQIWLGA